MRFWRLSRSNLHFQNVKIHPMLPTDTSSLDRSPLYPVSAGDVWMLSGAIEHKDVLRHFPIDEPIFSVGRKAGSTLKLRFKTVSGQHALLAIRDGQLFLHDLDSTNGSYVNGERIQGEVRVFEDDLIHFAEAPFRVLRKRSTGQSAGTIARNVCDEALALVQFDRMMNENLFRPHYQVIVDVAKGQPIGHEVLGRGSVFGLESIESMFQAASQLNLEVELSQALRLEGIRIGQEMPSAKKLFVNTHPKEMDDPGRLIDSLRQAVEICDDIGIVLEIHEASITSRSQLREVSSAVKDLGIELAFDDFGAGQARLAELIEARPDYVKFDLSLIHAIDQAGDAHRRMLRTLVGMVRDLEIWALAEGIETATEAQACLELGFDLAQGFYFGYPMPLYRSR